MIFPVLLALNVLKLTLCLKTDGNSTINMVDTSRKSLNISKDTSVVNDTALDHLSKSQEARSLKYLTPGQEFLLSVASFEDTKISNFDSLPYLMNILQKGNLDSKIGANDKKDDKLPVTGIPMRMLNAMKVMTATEKADENDSEYSEVAKPTGFLAKLAEDPMNILLAAIIPFSILLAAVIPLLVNQFMNGGSFPTVTTVAAGGSRANEQRRFLEKMIPILEGISSFGSGIEKDMIKENGEKKKVNILKSILHVVSSLISENWISKFSTTPVDRMRSCHGRNCNRKLQNKQQTN